jgi:type IV secretion system protein VirD4
MNQSLLLGWPIHSSITQTNADVHPLMKRRGQHDLSYSLKYEGDGHCITFAPTGSGKGVSAIIPNLLHYPGPVIVVDPKGENFIVTARYRSRHLGHKIILLDPFKKVSDAILALHNINRSSLNPLSLVHVLNGDIQNTAQMLAQLVSQGGTTKEDFWNIGARFLCAGLFYYEMTQALLANRKPGLYAVLDKIFNDDTVYNLAVMLDKLKPPDRFVTQTIGAFLQRADKERSGVLSTLQSFLTTMMAEDLRAHLDTTSFDITTIVRGDPCTIYIVIPPSKLDSHSFLLKAWISTLLYAVMERETIPETKTLFMLDECANLGQLTLLRKAVTLLRGYGLQVWMFFQDMSQLSFLYEDMDTFVNNCGVVQAFGMARLLSAKVVASTLGVYNAQDLMRLDRSQQVVSFAPGSVKACKSFRYYSDPAFANRFDINPLIVKPTKLIHSLDGRRRDHYRLYQ